MSINLKFPEGFLWGAATSSHQVEGGTNNNWSNWEKENAERLAKETKKKWQPWQQEKFPEMFDPKNYISGKACDHYNRFEQDFDLVKEGKHNAHRFSIEWSRIEPEEGKFDEKEIEHYRLVLKALRERGIEPFVTLWHWTNPLWLEEKGGAASNEFPKYFERYAKKMVEEYGDLANFWITINEPMSVISNQYVAGNWPPQKKNPLIALKVYKILAQAHNKAYDALHTTCPKVNVGFSHIMTCLEPYRQKSFLDRLLVKIADYFANKKFLKLTEGHNDFLALQYYFHYKLMYPGIVKNSNERVNDLGWELYPEAHYHLLKVLAEYQLPIYITESGLADYKGGNRTWYIKESLRWIHKAIEEGTDVKGYFYWSLLDNFEWDKGFWPRFGLVEIDYKTLERKPRASFYEYADICKNNEVEVE